MSRLEMPATCLIHWGLIETCLATCLFRFFFLMVSGFLHWDWKPFHVGLILIVHAVYL